MKLVLISGISRGLGLAFVKSLIDEGYCVAGFSQSKIDDDILYNSLFVSGKFYWAQLSISNPDEIEIFVKNAINFFPNSNLWGVINNAAISVDGVLATLPIIEIDKLLLTNLNGAIYFTRSVLRQMLRNNFGGRIINISSITGVRGYTGLSVYAASKAGLDGFTRSLAREVGRRQITVNSLAPGYMKSALSAGLNESQLSQIIKRTPLGRLCTFEDVSPILIFLMSNSASFITGQTFIIDGGLTN
jgi:3-oxoacyl-[acyl-carrier protein] reductase